MKPTFLKVKIKSLMLEAKCIRIEEGRASLIVSACGPDAKLFKRIEE